MMRWIPLMLALGCSEASYILELQPLLASNQGELLADGLDVTISVSGLEHATGTLADGAVEFGDVGVLAGDWVSVSLADGDEVVAYGEVGPMDLAKSGKPVTRSILVADTSGIASLGNLSREAVHGAAALTADGRAYVFGGSVEAGDDARDTIFASGSLDDGALAFESVGTLDEAVIGARANVVRVEGRELIVVTGGQAIFDEFGPYTRAVTVFDPSTHSVAWSGETNFPHAQHLALTMPSGKVLLASSGIDTVDTVDVNPYVELFNPVNNRSKEVDTLLDVGTWHIGGTVLMDGRALLCGGSILDDDDTTQSLPTDVCAFVDDAGTVPTLGLPTLPMPLHMHAMATLQDGRVLVTGGLTGPGDFNGVGPAQADAWLWDPANADTWVELPDMTAPRAKHQMVVLNDGRVAILGGATAASLLEFEVTEAIRCPEFFDPETNTFSTSNTCHGSGTGVDMAVSFHEDAGVLMIEGMQDGGSGGKRVGYMPAGPRP